MIINSDLELKCDIPLQTVTECTIEWSINCHAQLELTGEIRPEEIKTLPRQYIGKEIELFIRNHSDEKEGKIFKGMVSFIQFDYKYGSCWAVIKGISASMQLDISHDCHSFQDVSLSYADIAQSVIKKAGGAVISTTGKDKICRPHIQYKETAWEFIKRIASLSHTYIIPDINTGRPNVWFGMRHGVKISEMTSDWDGINIIKKYEANGESNILTSYQITSRKLYQIGDYKEIDGQNRMIYKVSMELKKGELIYQYMLASEKVLNVQPNFNENFTGLSLKGKVVKTENENVYIKLDVDGEEGAYPYPWKPESGNALYAMPELQATVSLYFTGPDERDAFGVRCLFTDKESTKHNNSDSAFKEQETTTGNKIGLFPKLIKVSIAGDSSLNIDDSIGINASSQGKISINAMGKIQIIANNIMVSVPEEIKIVTAI